MTPPTPTLHYGPYELVRRLGAGGMAETFLAVRRGPGRFEQRVCIKRILPAFEKDAAFVAQFLEEARVSATLRHANVVQVLDFGVVDGSHYLALELVEGVDLARLLGFLRDRGETLTSGLVAYLAVELGTALEHAHGLPSGAVLHRDISPSNVLLSRAGEVKLSDFGIAKASTMQTDPGARRTGTGVLKGKVPYMAAEYALTGRFEPRSDLFSLGVLLYEALAGTRPYVGNTDLDTLHRITTGEHPPLSRFRPEAPADLVAAIERLLRPDPGERFASAAAFLDALVESTPPPTARRILGELVRGVEAGLSGSEASRPVLLEGTVALTRAPAPPDPAPIPAPPDARTRTRVASDVAATEVHDAVGVVPTFPGLGADTEIASVHRAEAAPSSARMSEPVRTPRRLAAILAVASVAIGLTVLGGAVALVVSIADVGLGVRTSASPSGSSLSATTPQTEARGSASAASPPRGAGQPAAEQNAGARPEVGARTSEGSTQAPSDSPMSEPSLDPAATDEQPRGRVRVTVAPWGNVWIDGRLVGRAPVDARLAPGPHRIGIGFDTPVLHRLVRVRPGEAERVDVELDAP